jgi:drug/metabolite transporter (DMT)-like permease
VSEPAGQNAGAPGRAAIASSVAAIILIWAVNFVAAKVGVRYMPALALAAFRVTLAAALMVPLYLAGTERRARAESANEPRRGFSARDIWTFAYLGFFSVVMNQVCFTVGLRYTSVSHAAVIVGMGPMYALALAVLMKVEKATRAKVMGMAIAFAGIAVLAADNVKSAHSSLLGDAITFCGSMGFAMYVVLGKRVAGRYDSLTMTAFNHFAGGLLILPLAVRSYWWLRVSGELGRIPWQGWAAMVYMAVFASAVAYLLYFWLLRYFEPSRLTAFTYALPVVATLMGIVWLGEPATWGQAVGGVLALAGLYWVETGRG